MADLERPSDIMKPASLVSAIGVAICAVSGNVEGEYTNRNQRTTTVSRIQAIVKE
jgi:hypothetical protein